MRSSFLFASFLAVVPIISANPTRRQAAQQALPTISKNVFVTFPTGTNYVFQGCYVDSETARILPHPADPSEIFIIRVGSCMDACSAHSFKFGGIENGGRSCFCGNEFGGQPGVDRSKCQVPCLDHYSEACGDFNLALIYALGPLPTIIKEVPVTSVPGANYIFQGCYVDSETARILPQQVNPTGKINVGNCLESCTAKNLVYGGIENGGRSCFCGSSLTETGIDEAQCQVACVDNSTQACGDFNLALVYEMQIG